MADIREHDVTVEVLVTSPPLVRYHVNDMNLMLYRLDRSLIDYIDDEDFKNHIKGNGVYFYIEPQKPLGIEEETGNLVVQPMRIYVGEGEDVRGRYRTHAGDLWQDWETLVFVWDYEMSLSLRRSLEKRFIALARQHGEYFVMNKKSGSNEATPRVEKKRFNNLMDLIPWLMYTAGFDFLMSPEEDKPSEVVVSPASEVAPNGEPVFHFHTNDDPDMARGYPRDGGFVVMAGSKAKPAQHYLSRKDMAIREGLVRDGILVNDVFVRDWFTDGHKRASRIITGTTGGGQDNRWTTEKGLPILIHLGSMQDISGEGKD